MNKLRKLYEQLNKARKAHRQAEGERYARLVDYRKAKARHLKQRTAFLIALQQDKPLEKVVERLRTAKRARDAADSLLADAERAEIKARYTVAKCSEALLDLAEKSNA